MEDGFTHKFCGRPKYPLSSYWVGQNPRCTISSNSPASSRPDSTKTVSGKPGVVQEAYWRWLEGQILTPIKEHFSDLYAFLVALHRRQIAEVAAMKSTESGDDKGNTLYVKAAIVHAALEFAPPLIRQSLLDDPEFSQEFEITIEASLSFGDFSIQRAELFDAVRDTLGGAATPSVKDSDGREWTLRNEAETGKPPKLVLVSNGRRRGLAAFSVLAGSGYTIKLL